MPKKPTQTRENKCLSCGKAATAPAKKMRVMVEIFGMLSVHLKQEIKGLVDKVKRGAEGIAT